MFHAFYHHRHASDQSIVLVSASCRRTTNSWCSLQWTRSRCRSQAVDICTNDEFQPDDFGPRVVHSNPAPHGGRRPTLSHHVTFPGSSKTSPKKGKALRNQCLEAFLLPGQSHNVPLDPRSHCRNSCSNQKIFPIFSQRLLHGPAPYVLCRQPQGHQARWCPSAHQRRGRPLPAAVRQGRFTRLAVRLRLWSTSNGLGRRPASAGFNRRT